MQQPENASIISTTLPMLDQVLSVLLSTPMFVGGFLGFFLDNTIPGESLGRLGNGWGKLRGEELCSGVIILGFVAMLGYFQYVWIPGEWLDRCGTGISTWEGGIQRSQVYTSRRTFYYCFCYQFFLLYFLLLFLVFLLITLFLFFPNPLLRHGGGARSGGVAVNAGERRGQNDKHSVHR